MRSKDEALEDDERVVLGTVVLYKLRSLKFDRGHKSNETSSAIKVPQQGSGTTRRRETRGFVVQERSTADFAAVLGRNVKEQERGCFGAQAAAPDFFRAVRWWCCACYAGRIAVIGADAQDPAQKRSPASEEDSSEDSSERVEKRAARDGGAMKVSLDGHDLTRQWRARETS